MKTSRTWAEISLQSLTHNYFEIRKRLNESTKIMSIVKADAYGHGDVQCASALERCGTDYFGVATIDEALGLRRGGIKKPILVLGFIPDCEIEDAVLNDITLCVYSAVTAEKISQAAVAAGKTARVHIKVDTGMGRIGFLYGYGEESDSKTVAEISAAVKLPGIDAEGIFTHFSNADSPDDSKTAVQFSRFNMLIERLGKCEAVFKLRHCCNSAATLRYPQMQLDMVRPGIILYGCVPDNMPCDSSLFRYVMSLRTKIINIKEVDKNCGISYGEIFKTTGRAAIATLPAGYADGLPRITGNSLEVLAGDSPAKIVGRICMDQCMIDVTNVNNICVGDTVTFFGYRNGAVLPVENISALCGTIPYETLCNISKRVPRIYM